jgi:hypothetical protein
LTTAWSVEQRPAGVVDEHVDPSKLRERLLDCRVDLIWLGDVTLKRDRHPAKLLDLLGELVERVRGPRDEREIGSRLGVRECDRSPDSARGAGHERLPARQ